MDDNGGLGILPTKNELTKKAQAKPSAAPAVEAPAPKAPKKRAKDRKTDLDAEPVVRTGSMLLALKTQVGQERRVAEAFGGKAKRFKLPVLGLLWATELRGLVFIETTDPLAVEKGIRGVSYARGLMNHNLEVRDEDGKVVRKNGMTVVKKEFVEIPFSDISRFLTPASAVAKIAEGDIVELVSGPFRGEKAKVTRVDDTREEITVELVESMVPIPITTKGEQVRVLQKGGSA